MYIYLRINPLIICQSEIKSYTHISRTCVCYHSVWLQLDIYQNAAAHELLNHSSSSSSPRLLNGLQLTRRFSHTTPPVHQPRWQWWCAVFVCVCGNVLLVNLIDVESVRLCNEHRRHIGAVRVYSILVYERGLNYKMTGLGWLLWCWRLF